MALASGLPYVEPTHPVVENHLYHVSLSNEINQFT